MEKDKRRRDRLGKWLKRKFQGAEPFGNFHDAEDDTHDDCSEYDAYDEDFVGLMEMSGYTRTNEFRIFVGTWNLAGRPPVGSLAVDLDDWLNLRDAADIYVLGFQEIVPLKTSNVIGTEDPTPAARWNALIDRTLNNKYGCPWLETSASSTAVVGAGSNGGLVPEKTRTPLPTKTPLTDREFPRKPSGCYVILTSKKMVGVFVSIWVKKELLKRYHISSVKVCEVGCGIMGYLGNKGSVAVSMCIEGTSFCFVAAHLASGEKQGDETRRNYQVAEIFRRTVFPRPPQDDYKQSLPQTILGHDRIFWFGDLNYRLYLEDSSARQLIKKNDWKALKEFDQLKKEQNDGVFRGWREGDIEFAPTYKYSTSNCNRYSGGVPNRYGEKQRTPAWCDRILWFGKDVKQLSYDRSESKFSDHRPVSALFSIQIETLRCTNPLIAALPTLSTFLPSLNEPNDEDCKSENTLLSLLVKDI
ncbi:type I inositol polyphosphate 5-phosphatase 8-like [Aristolochia californica]|uniref:type I inositol polyphosphate 5-phosphatase 8-like n=1 Tax=Aristolochia californica TaxID=171875 RepID=UPI0035D94C10